jgi:hypothetical protein
VHYLAILLAAFGISFSAGLPSPERPEMNRACFSKRLWSGDDQNRPCVRILRVEEDGSFQAAVDNADGNRRSTVSVSNPSD